MYSVRTCLFFIASSNVEEEKGCLRMVSMNSQESKDSTKNDEHNVCWLFGRSFNPSSCTPSQRRSNTTQMIIFLKNCPAILLNLSISLESFCIQPNQHTPLSSRLKSIWLPNPYMTSNVPSHSPFWMESLWILHCILLPFVWIMSLCLNAPWTLLKGTSSSIPTMIWRMAFMLVWTLLSSMNVPIGVLLTMSWQKRINISSPLITRPPLLQGFPLSTPSRTLMLCLLYGRCIQTFIVLLHCLIATPVWMAINPLSWSLQFRTSRWSFVDSFCPFRTAQQPCLIILVPSRNQRRILERLFFVTIPYRPLMKLPITCTIIAIPSPSSSKIIRMTHHCDLEFVFLLLRNIDYYADLRSAHCPLFFVMYVV